MRGRNDFGLAERTVAYGEECQRSGRFLEAYETAFRRLVYTISDGSAEDETEGTQLCRLDSHLLGCDARRNFVPFEKPIGLWTAQAQGLCKLMVANPVLAVKFYEKCLPRLATEVSFIGGNFTLDFWRYLKTDVHDPFLLCADADIAFKC